MKKLYATLFILYLLPAAYGQSFSLGDLVSSTSYTASKFDNFVGRKGYKAHGPNNGADSVAYTYFDKKAKAEQPEKLILKCDKEDKAMVAFQTDSEQEFLGLKEQLIEQGYYYSEGAQNPLYQKGAITITPVTKTVEDKTLYCFVIEKKSLPKARDVQYAEDFLKFTSHEYLASAFGEANVKRDVFYFSDTEVNKCSVLFPNTNMQVIFIWKDQANNRDIAFLLIGGQLRPQSLISYHKQIELNTWQSRQGIRAGMSLRELQQLNNNNIKVYGWDSNQPGVVTNNNSGNINFKSIGLVLNCLDCNEDKYYSKTSVLNSADLLQENRRVYVSTLVILPEKKK